MVHEGLLAASAGEKATVSYKTDRGLNTLMTLGAAGYAWQIYGIWVGLGVLIALWLVRRFTAYVITMRWVMKAAARDEEMEVAPLLKLTSRSRWAWVIFAFIVLALSAAEVCTGPACKSI